MNWITKFIKPKIKSLFEKKSSKIEENLWTTCGCKNLIYKEDLESNLKCCPKCGAHHKLSCKERFDTFFDNKEYELIKTPLPKDDPLNWTDSQPYKNRLKNARKKTGLDCSMVVASGSINNIKITAIASDFDFMGASIGAAEGEAFLFAAQHAIENKQPLLVVSSGGGMKMQESLISLSQMTRTTLAINEVKAAGLPYIVLLTDPTAGGITASYAMLGDIHLAEPEALVAFAGARVIQGTVKEELPSSFQVSESVLNTGFIDKICHRKDLNEEIGKLLSILLKKNSISTEEIDETSEDTQQISKTA